MKNFFITFLAVICILGTISCNKEQLGNYELKTIKESIDEGDLDFNGEVFWLGPEYEDKDVFLDRSSFVSDIESADIVVLSGTALEANKDIIDKAYWESKVIILCDPDLSVYNRIAETLGWPTSVMNDEETELFAFSLVGTSSLLTPEDAIVIDTPEILPDSDSDLSVPDSAPYKDGIIEEYEEPDFDEIIKLKYIINPLIEMVNTMFVDLDCATKADGEDKFANYISDAVSVTIPVKLCFAKTAASDSDYINGDYQVTARWRYLPVYAFSNKNTSGDYYIMNLSYSSHMGSAWKGEDLVRTHGAVDVHYSGAFLRQLDVKTYIKGDKVNPRFLEGYTPIPESVNNVTNYSKTRGWNIGGGITRGVEASSDAAKAKYETSFSWGYSNSSTVSFSMADMKIEKNDIYNENGDVAQWHMICQNLPRKDGTRHITKNCPSVAKSTFECHTNWMWHSDKYGDGDKESIGDMVIELHPILGIARNGFWFKFADYSYDLGSQEITVPLKAPNRTPFATISLKNTIPNIVIRDLQVKDNRNRLVYKSKGDLLENNALEMNLALGKYSMSFTGTNKRTGAVNTYVLSDGNYVVDRARTGDNDIITLDAVTRFKIK